MDPWADSWSLVLKDKKYAAATGDTPIHTTNTVLLSPALCPHGGCGHPTSNSDPATQPGCLPAHCEYPIAGHLVAESSNWRVMADRPGQCRVGTCRSGLASATFFSSFLSELGGPPNSSSPAHAGASPIGFSSRPLSWLGPSSLSTFSAIVNLRL